MIYKRVDVAKYANLKLISWRNKSIKLSKLRFFHFKHKKIYLILMNFNICKVFMKSKIRVKYC